MCNKTIYKFTLVSLNIVFTIIGAVILASGLWIKFDENGVIAIMQKLVGETGYDTGYDIDSLLATSSTIFIIVGATIFGIGFFGCAGAFWELRLFLIIYGIILGVFVVVLIAVCIAIVFFKGQVDAELVPFLKNNLQNGYMRAVHFEGDALILGSGASGGVSVVWDVIQFSMECCAIQNIDEYGSAINWQKNYTYGGVAYTDDVKIPPSCCRLIDPTVFPDRLDKAVFVNIPGCLTSPNGTTANLDGCYDKLSDLLEEYEQYVIAALVVLILLMIGAIFVTCFLSKGISKEYQTV